MNLNFDTICRCCLKSSVTGCVLMKLDSNYNNLPIAEIISTMTNIEIPVGDNIDSLPDHICLTCWKKFKSAYLLREQFQRSDKYLRDHIIQEPAIEIKILYDQIDVVNNIIDSPEPETEPEEELIDVKPCFVDVNEANAVSESGVLQSEEEHEEEEEEEVIEQSLQCICGFQGKNQYQMQIHVNHHNYPFTCIVCNSTSKPLVNNEEDLIKHYNLHHFILYVKEKEELNSYQDIKPYFCTVCGADYNNFEFLRNHMLRHKGKHQAPKWRESGSDITLVNGLSMNRNKTKSQIRANEEPQSCEICGKLFKTANALMKHSQLHEQKYQCTHCGKFFGKLFTLKEHERAQHSANKYIYSCDLCPKKFSFPHNLSRHKLVHQGIKPYKCDLCDKSFSQMNKMKIHRNIHTGDKPYFCDVVSCNKSFSDPSSLHGHKKRHIIE